MAELMTGRASHDLGGASIVTFSHSLRTILETIRHRHPDKVKALLQALLNDHHADAQGVNSEPEPENEPSAAAEATSILEELFDTTSIVSLIVVPILTHLDHTQATASALACFTRSLESLSRKPPLY
eukprot:SAG11_NODE_4946_length_1713_cov_26.703841_1_plen_127_part_00